MMIIERNWLEILEGWPKVKVVLWSSLCKKRYYIFEQQLEWGKSARAAFKDVDKLNYKETQLLYKKIKNDKIGTSNS